VLTLMSPLPKQFTDFKRNYPRCAAAYEAFGTECHAAGPLDEKTRALVKLALSVGARLEGGAHAQVRKALALGVSPEELRQVALLAMPTIGFPASMAAMSWIDDLTKRKRASARKK
jgi:4-carboxymuconolactone decarboxylase